MYAVYQTPGTSQIHSGERRRIQPASHRDSRSESSLRKQSFSQSGSARARIQDRCHQQARSYSSLGARVLYVTTRSLGFIFNLRCLLRNVFFLQIIKLVCYCPPMNWASFIFKGKVGYLSHKTENQEWRSNKPLWQHRGKKPRGQLNNPRTRN